MINFKLEVFDGPLELLLHLISKNKVSIYDIPIAMILDQYMDYIDDLKKMDMDVSSEFIEMAAHLIYLKSKMLLPKEENDEEDPRLSLVLALEEYKRYKTILPKLSEMAKGFGKTYVRQQEAFEVDKTHKLTYESTVLYDAYMAIFDRQKRVLPPPVKSFDGIVGRQIASVPVKIISILRTLKRNIKISFTSLFKKAKSRTEIVATFLAVLELTKSKHVSLHEKDKEIYLNFKENEEEN